MKSRNNGKTGRMLLASVIWVAVLFIYYNNSLAGQSHVFSTGDCILCHESEKADSPFSISVEGEQIHSACDNCHGACESWGVHRGRALEAVHPIVALPSADDGEIVCITCHDPHPEDFHHASYESPNLRIANLKRELCLNCHSGNADGQWLVQVAAPPSSAVVRDRHVPLLGRAEAIPDTHLDVHVNGATFPLKVRRGTFHTRLTLQEGVNVVEVRFRDERLWRGELFLAAGEERNIRYDRTFYGHQTSSYKECLSCHGTEEGIFRTEVRAGSTLCYQCHDEFDEKRYLHGPLAVGDCNICHDPHGGIGPNHLQAEEAQLCRSCHGDDEVLGHRGGREGLAEGSCSECHDPHQSDGRFFMKQALL